MLINRAVDNIGMSLRGATILVVDDDPVQANLVYQALNNDFTVKACTNGAELFELIERNLPDLILLDIHLPDINGVEICRRLVADERYAAIPVIFMTASMSSDIEDVCWSVGADDFIVKPVNPTTLINRVKNQLAIRLQSGLLEKLAYTDVLTGTYNRRFFSESLLKHVAVAGRNDQQLSLLMVDVDNFKLYNDVYGHVMGDKCLADVAESMIKSLKRAEDMVCRYGGEEFTVLLPNTGLEGALQVAERIRAAVELRGIKHSESSWQVVTVSIGVAIAQFDTSDDVASLLVNQADENLYRSKAGGRNRISAPAHH